MGSFPNSNPNLYLSQNSCLQGDSLLLKMADGILLSRSHQKAEATQCFQEVLKTSKNNLYIKNMASAVPENIVQLHWLKEGESCLTFLVIGSLFLCRGCL